jgi:hypothetical protein
VAKKRLEECTAEELTLDGIRKRTAAFNHMFETAGGYKTYELQCIEILLAEIDRLASTVGAEHGT